MEVAGTMGLGDSHAPADVDTGFSSTSVNQDDPRYNDYIDAMNKQAQGPPKDPTADPAPDPHVKTKPTPVAPVAAAPVKPAPAYHPPTVAQNAALHRFTPKGD